MYGLAPLLGLCTLADDARRERFHQRQLAPATWGRILSAFQRLKAPMVPAVSVARWIRLVEPMLVGAPADVKDDLIIKKSDLVDTQSSTAVAIIGVAGLVTPTEVLDLITWGDLLNPLPSAWTALETCSITATASGGTATVPLAPLTVQSRTSCSQGPLP